MAIETDQRAIILPLQAETIDVSKRQVVTGRVSVAIETETFVHAVTEKLSRDAVDVKRVAIGTMTDVMPEPRQEGDMLIIPVVEEVLVRRFLITEEVRICRRHQEEPYAQDVTLRHQTVTVTRHATDDTTSSTPEIKKDFMHGQ